MLYPTSLAPPVAESLALALRRISAADDTFGVHQIGLYKFDEALRLLTAWLPRGPRADSSLSVDADGLLASSERSALVTVTHYTTQGSAEIAGASTDLILARHDGRVHAFSRDPLNRAAQLRAAANVFVIVLSAGLAWVNTGAAKYCWLLLAVVPRAADRWSARRAHGYGDPAD